MSKRTDVHSPSNLVTEDYKFFACGDYGSKEDPSYSPLITPYGQQLLADGWKFADTDNGAGCMHCGARLRYYALLLHAKSHSIVRVGETCLDNRFSLATKDFHKLRKAAKLNRERRVMAEVRAEFARDNADVIAFLAEKITECEARYGFVPDPEYDTYLNLRYWEFYLSLNAQLARKGLLSEGQVNALRKSAAKDAERKAARAEEIKDAEPCPTGKVVITGEVVKTDLKVNDFGSREVMTVKDDRGFSVWGTQPAKITDDIKVGARITFTATVEAADNDPYRGFFKRPSKASVVS